MHATLGDTFWETIIVDYIAIIIIVVMVLSRVFRKLSPIHLVIISACLGLVLYLI